MATLWRARGLIAVGLVLGGVPEQRLLEQGVSPRVKQLIRVLVVHRFERTARGRKNEEGRLEGRPSSNC